MNEYVLENKLADLEIRVENLERELPGPKEQKKKLWMMMRSNPLGATYTQPAYERMASQALDEFERIVKEINSLVEKTESSETDLLIYGIFESIKAKLQELR